MSALDTLFRNLASNLVSSYGVSVTYRRETKTYDVSTGTNSTSNTDYDVKMSPPAPHNRPRAVDNYEDGDMTAIIAASQLDVTPNATTDKVVYNGTTWQIVGVTPIASGEQIAAYELHLRQ